MTYFDVMSFGPSGWGTFMLQAAGMTLLVSAAAYVGGVVFGALGAWAKLSSSLVIRFIGATYTSLIRGVPELLIIFLFYFGGSLALSHIAGMFDGSGTFVEMPPFWAGALAIAIVSGAYQTEVMRAAFLSINKGEIEAARAFGMTPSVIARRLIIPQGLRFALPGMGNVSQLVLKESALVSVTGLVELVRQSQIGSGSTREPFFFYLTAGALYLVITAAVTVGFSRAERRFALVTRRATQ